MGATRSEETESGNRAIDLNCWQSRDQVHQSIQSRTSRSRSAYKNSMIMPPPPMDLRHCRRRFCDAVICGFSVHL
jgi:hypothetical protein